MGMYGSETALSSKTITAAKDNLLAEAHTDRTGDFKLTGNEAEADSIGRYLIINHHCSEAVDKELVS